MTSSSAASAAPAPDWSSLIDHCADIGYTWIKGLAEQAKLNVPKLQEGSYDRDDWIEDVSSFYKSLADNAAAVAKACNDLFPQQ